MTEALTFITIGLGIFISINTFKKAAWVDGLYWSVFCSLGYFLTYGFVPYYFFLFLIPGFIRLQLNQLNQKKALSDQLTGTFALLTIAILTDQFTSFGLPVVGILFIIELFSTARTIRRTFQKMGIASAGNAGHRITWMKWFFGLNLLLLLGLFFNQWLGQPQLLFSQILFYLIGLLGLIKYQVSNESLGLIKLEKKYAKSTLDQAEKYRIITSIDKAFDQEKFHLNSEASLKLLATKIKATTHAVSQVINEEKDLSFFDLLAVHRVRESRQLLKNKKYQHYKIEQIAEEVGYLSKSAFNTSFKKITGLTPSEYRDQRVREDRVERLKDREITQSLSEGDTFEYLKLSTIMMANFLKLYFRNLNKNRLFSFLNISGLIVGFTSCVLIFLYLTNEVSYDSFHERSEDIYRVYLDATNPQTRTPHPMAQALVRDFSEVESAVSLTPLYGPGLTLQSMYIRNPENNVMFKESDGFAADSTFFDVFDFDLLSGDPNAALSDIGSVVITESMAKKYFGNEDPLGKKLEAVASGATGVITGVMEDPPRTSHFHPRFIMSYITLKSGNPENPWFSWGDPGHFNYIKLKPKSDPNNIVQAIPEWIKTVSSEISPLMMEYIQDGTISFQLQPIESIHLNSHLRWELESNSSYTYIYILTAAILFTIAILSINFINLSTARTYERSKEVGIRKVLGATRLSMSTQFISEALFTCLISMAIAFGISWLLLDEFNQLTQEKFLVSELLNPTLIGYGLLLVLGIGFLSGMIPSISLNKVDSSEIFKGRVLSSNSRNWKRLSLVGIQFVFSTILIFGSLIILKQVKFIENKSMGFDEEALIVLRLQTPETGRSFQAIKNELLKESSVLSVGGISNLPGGQFNQNDLFLESDPSNRVPASELWVDYDGLETLGIDLHEGRFFDPSFQLDSSGGNFIINRIAARELNLEDAVDAAIIWDDDDGQVPGTVVGVVEDFNYKSLHEPIRPLLVMVGLSYAQHLIIRVNTSDVANTLTSISNLYQTFDKVFTPDISFLDDRMNLLYESERRSFKIFNLFSAVALALAAIGLLGLAYLVITQRTKEIGIRKVLGARITDILWMENSSFLKVVAVAFIIGIPVSIYFMKQWLNEFAYQTSFGVSPFVSTLGILVIVAVASITLAVLKTVLKNPSEALRYE